MSSHEYCLSNAYFTAVKYEFTADRYESVSGWSEDEGSGMMYGVAVRVWGYKVEPGSRSGESATSFTWSTGKTIHQLSRDTRGECGQLYFTEISTHNSKDKFLCAHERPISHSWMTTPIKAVTHVRETNLVPDIFIPRTFHG